MAVVVNTGILTGYHSFHFKFCLLPCSDFMQTVFSGCCGYSEIPIVVPSVSSLSLYLKRAAMPKTYIFLSIQFLFPKCMSKAFFEDGVKQQFRFSIYQLILGTAEYAILHSDRQIPHCQCHPRSHPGLKS
jgi:hypothetical protein